EREEAGAPAIAQLDTAGLARKHGDCGQRDEEVQTATEEAREVVAVLVDRDGAVGKDAVVVLDEARLLAERLGEARDPAVRKRTGAIPGGDERDGDERGESGNRGGRARGGEQPEGREKDGQVRTEADREAPRHRCDDESGAATRAGRVAVERAPEEERAGDRERREERVRI